jgi:putative nucleotidyltransferase with HDIG domain
MAEKKRKNQGSGTDKRSRPPDRARTRKPLTIAARLRGFFQGLVERMVALGAVWMMVFLLGSLGLFYLQYRPGYPEYEVGQVARDDVRAPTAFAVPDPDITDERREEARLEVRPVYDLDSRALESYLARLEEFLLSARGVISDPLTITVPGIPAELPDAAGVAESTAAAGPVPLNAELLNILDEMSPFALDDPILTLFYRFEFDQRLLAAARIAGESGLADPFVEDRETLRRRGGERGLMAIDVFTRGEVLYGDIDEIGDRNDLRGRLDAPGEQLQGFDPDDRDTLLRFLAETLPAPLTYNRNETRARQEMAAAAIPEVTYNIPRNKIIVREGDLISERVLEQLDAMRRNQKFRWGGLNLLGISFILVLILAALLRFLESHQQSFGHFRNLDSLLFMVLTLSLALTGLSLFIFEAVGGSLSRFPFNNLSSYYFMIPFCFGGLLLSLITNRNLAMMFAVAYSLLAALLLDGSFPLAAFSLAGNFMAIYGPIAYTTRTALMRSGLLLGLVNALLVGTLSLLQPDFSLSIQLPFEMACAFAGGALAILLVFVFLPLFETLFHLVTDFRLLELSNLDSPLLRELALRAPGTYHHSVIVGHLAEAAAKAIGANALFVRVASYYHDVGKMLKPEYYIENIGSAENKHDKLAPRMSALILVAHVKEGMEIAAKHNIVPAIIDIIPQHHGTRLMTFFYNKAKEQAGEDEQSVNEINYRYPGPKPLSNEAAVIMLADAVEAASRTLTDPSPSRLKGLVQKIVSTIALDGQLDSCNLTLKDLETISAQFLRILGGIFHQRLDYPGFNFQPMSNRNGEAEAVTEQRPAGGRQLP